MKTIISIAILFCLCFALSALADGSGLADKHKENGMKCADCHLEDTPTKKASAKQCIACHGDMKDSKELSFKDQGGKEYKLSPHNSHAGQIRCTLCHSGHNPSKLYCNTCHHTFQISVP
ncbi:cytochrome c3 family protein [Seleniivibrio sp.]|uniref:cytochrome c3 family protein n=1 Tax=Seleniivibrio sp. TaxID=2898801 RepID=UPI0025F35302|nr:cytochrome c3 family protein [Seleniivibrio sp.]MCD8553600.1 cytochrome c3 family protein [Seleniivibrio sp.]